MEIKVLDKKQIVDVYNTHMIVDFPSDELKPLKRILTPLKKGRYICYGLFEEGSDELLGYAFFVKMGNHYLFDYLGVTKARRGSGIGTEFLKLLKVEFRDCESVIGEVEDPDYAKDDIDVKTRKRRLRFYLQTGYLDTGLRVKLFGVDYIVVEMDLGKSRDKESLTQLYLSHYKEMLPKMLFNKMVSIKQF